LSQINYKNESLGMNGVRLLGIILMPAGLLVLFVPLFFEVSTDLQKIGIVGGGSFLVGVILVSIYSGTLLDFEKSRFKEYQSIFWFKIGDWKELPKIEQAELILHSFRSRNTPNGISPTLSHDVTIYKCVLISHGSKFLAFDFAKHKDAVAALGEIKTGLGI